MVWWAIRFVLMKCRSLWCVGFIGMLARCLTLCRRKLLLGCSSSRDSRCRRQLLNSRWIGDWTGAAAVSASTVSLTAS